MAIWLYLKWRPGEPVPRTSMVVLGLVSGLVHPYLAVMVIALLGAIAGRVWLESRGQREGQPLDGVLAAGAAVCLVAAGWWASGLFTVPGASMARRGLGLFSMNLLAPVTHSGWSALLPALPVATGGQDFEGFQYLGLGILIDFSASWCKPCKQSFPWLNDMQAKYKQLGFEVVAINVDQEQSAANDFLQKLSPQFTVAFDPSGRTAEQFHVQGLPSSYLIDRQGNVRAAHVGFREADRAKLEQAVTKLLQEK